MHERAFDLDERLIEFAARIIIFSETLPKTTGDSHLANQLTRSGTAPALHYGEAQRAESRNDFIHKMKVALKELGETYNCLRVIKRIDWKEVSRPDWILDENNQLISIFVKSIETAQRNNNKQQSKVNGETRKSRG
jgi:four helix bundle protein